MPRGPSGVTSAAPKPAPRNSRVGLKSRGRSAERRQRSIAAQLTGVALIRRSSPQRTAVELRRDRLVRATARERHVDARIAIHGRADAGPEAAVARPASNARRQRALIVA